MNDPLTQLLRNADRQAPAPILNPIGLPVRVRQAAERQFHRRITVGVFATIPVLACILLIVIQRVRQPQAPLVEANLPSDQDLAMQIAYHQRVADMLEANPPIASQPAVTDAFLQKLQLERSKAALVLLKIASNQTDQSPAQRIDHLRQMIALFPETSAAAVAAQRIRQSENTRSQS